MSTIFRGALAGAVVVLGAVLLTEAALFFTIGGSAMRTESMLLVQLLGFSVASVLGGLVAQRSTGANALPVAIALATMLQLAAAALFINPITPLPLWVWTAMFGAGPIAALMGALFAQATARGDAEEVVVVLQELEAHNDAQAELPAA